MFQTEGQNGKNLKFHFNFKAEVTHAEETTIGQKSNYCTPGEILKMNGRSLADFEEEEDAMEDVQFLVRKNQEEHGHSNEDHPPDVCVEKPLYSRFWYVKSEGKAFAFKQTETKSLTGDADMKDTKALESGMQFLEGMGFQEGSAPAQIESVKFAQLMKSLEALRSAFQFPKAGTQHGQHRRLKMQQHKNASCQDTELQNWKTVK